MRCVETGIEDPDDNPMEHSDEMIAGNYILAFLLFAFSPKTGTARLYSF